MIYIHTSYTYNTSYPPYAGPRAATSERKGSGKKMRRGASVPYGTIAAIIFLVNLVHRPTHILIYKILIYLYTK